MNKNQNCPRNQLLHSLKPYLEDEKKEKLEQYIKIANLLSVMEDMNMGFNFFGEDKKIHARKSRCYRKISDEHRRRKKVEQGDCQSALGRLRKPRVRGRDRQDSGYKRRNRRNGVSRTASRARLPHGTAQPQRRKKTHFATFIREQGQEALRARNVRRGQFQAG